MVKPAKNSLKIAKKRIFIIICLVILAIASLGAYKLYSAMPQDLGPKLQYIGKKDFGCAPFPFFFFCDHQPYSEYYFATDLTEADIKSHFKKATYSTSRDKERSTTDTQHDLPFENNTSKKRFALYYYFDQETINSYNDEFNSRAKYIISILDKEYQTVKESL